MAERRSLWLALAVLGAGVLLAAIGAGRTWVRVRAGVDVPGLGESRFAGAGLTGNDLAPLSALALLGLVAVVGIAVTRGRGRWLVGAALLALGAALAVQAVTGVPRLRDQAVERAASGQLEGVPAGAGIDVGAQAAGPALVATGGVLLAAAGAVTARRGPAWPALGDAFRAPGDRAARTPDAGEPPWEGE